MTRLVMVNQTDDRGGCAFMCMHTLQWVTGACASVWGDGFGCVNNVVRGVER